jgi:hypothetical protein
MTSSSSFVLRLQVLKVAAQHRQLVISQLSTVTANTVRPGSAAPST